jgi:hypothetical protein
MIAFGLWDIFFYAFLRVLIGWPTSLFDWDLLFLLPLPWVGPVLAPVLVALTMIVAGIVLLRQEALGRPVRWKAGHCGAILSGGVTIVVAFCWDFRNSLAGGMPNPFHWSLFAIGLLLGLAAFVHALSLAPCRFCLLFNARKRLQALNRKQS